MLTLIKREMADNIAYFLGALIISALLIIILTASVYTRTDMPPFYIYSFGLSLPLIIAAIIGFCAVGASQMYTDKNAKISSFLSTQPVTRTQLLIAKIVTGTLVILTFFVPLVIATFILMRIFMQPFLASVYLSLFRDAVVVIFLMSFSCYCIGLQTGWNQGKIIPTLGAIILTAIFIPLIFVKGISLQIVIILLLFIAASLIRTWQKFMSTSL